MTEDEIKELSKRIDAWCKSSEGKAKLKATADLIVLMQQKAEQKRREDAVWWAENKHKPIMTIQLNN